MAQIERDQIAAAATLAQVIEAGSFTAAASKLGCTPSAVSKQIGRLEDSLGLRLLERTTRSLRATDAGLHFYESSRALFEAFAEAKNELLSRQDALRGTVRISASPAFGRARLAPVLASLLEAHPELDFDVMLTARRTDLVEEGIDVAIREGTLEDSGIVARSLGAMPIVWAASPLYLSRRPKPRQLADLSRHDLLLVPAALSGLQNLKLKDKQGKRVALQPRVVMDDLFAIAELAQSGAGIAALPGYVLEQFELQPLLPRSPLSKLPIHAVFPSRRHLPRKVEVILDALTRQAKR